MTIDKLKIKNKSGFGWFGLAALGPFISVVVLIFSYIRWRNIKLKYTPTGGGFWGVILLIWGLLMLAASIGLLFEKDAFGAGLFFMIIYALPLVGTAVIMLRYKGIYTQYRAAADNLLLNLRGGFTIAERPAGFSGVKGAPYVTAEYILRDLRDNGSLNYLKENGQLKVVGVSEELIQLYRYVIEVPRPKTTASEEWNCLNCGASNNTITCEYCGTAKA